MTDEQARELGERAIACKDWRWLPGMLTHRDTASAHVCWRILRSPVGDGHIAAYRVECGQRIYPRVDEIPPPEYLRLDAAELGKFRAIGYDAV